MAGHSKWANIKHRKERADKKKGKVFSRIMKEVISAVRQGGADPKANSKLRVAIQKAKEANLPGDSVERNIKKAASTDQMDYIEMTYELYGFGGVGLMVDVMTDNKNRIASEMRIATNKCGGTIAAPGSVAYNFDRKGEIRVLRANVDELQLFDLVSEAGAENFQVLEESFLITTTVEGFAKVVTALKEAKVPLEESELAMVPKVTVDVSDSDADANIALIEWLENLDDVDAVFHNMQI